LSEQGIVFSEIDATIVNKYESVDAEGTVSEVEAGVAACITGETDVNCILICLRFAYASIFIKLEVIVCRAIVGVIHLDVVRTVTINRAEVNSDTSWQTGETVSCTVTGIASSNCLSTVLTNGASSTVKTGNAYTPTSHILSIPTLHARFTLG